MSRAVAMPPPVQRPGLGDHASLLHHPDRLALIAFADGIQVGHVSTLLLIFSIFRRHVSLKSSLI